jgi:hypothetical protein
MKNQKLYTLPAAIKKLDIDQHTLMTWIMLDFIEVVTIPDEKTGRHYPHISEHSIKKAFDASCVICNKTFKAKYPLNAMYCSQKCRNKGIYLNFKAKAAQPKTKKAKRNK